MEIHEDEDEFDFVENELAKAKDTVRNKPVSASKFQTYQALNPTLDVHPLYTTSKPTIPDYLRISFTRYRLSSHRLRVEIGRWSRTLHDERVCSCGTGVQDEIHIFQCPLVKDIFDSYGKAYTAPSDIFLDTTIEDLELLHKVLKTLDVTVEDQPTE